MIVLIVLVGVVGAVLSIWGSQTRGSMSQAMASVGGIMWIASVGLGFWKLGLGKGALFLLATFVLGAIVMRVAPSRV